MFTSDEMIDTIQNGKKTAISIMVQNDHIKEALNKFVDAQTAYTKGAVKATSDAATVVMQETVKAAQDAMKFDYVKFGEGVMKAYQGKK